MATAAAGVVLADPATVEAAAADLRGDDRDSKSQHSAWGPGAVQTVDKPTLVPS
jgi:hypothetical protein